MDTHDLYTWFYISHKTLIVEIFDICNALAVTHSDFFLGHFYFNDIPYVSLIVSQSVRVYIWWKNAIDHNKICENQ